MPDFAKNMEERDASDQKMGDMSTSGIREIKHRIKEKSQQPINLNVLVVGK